MSPTSFEKVPCPLGCQENDQTVVTGRDLLHDVEGEFTVVRCGSCGLMRTNPRPTLETIYRYYPDNYGPYLRSQVRQTDSVTSGGKKLLRSIVSKAFNSNANRLPQMNPGRMLEVGCASGAYLHKMKEDGWEVEGIEFSSKAAAAASALGYRVHAGPLETAPAPTEQYDLIVGWMVLEHLHDPISSLETLREWSKPGAWLVLSVPNAASLEFKLFKDKWYALQVPTHLHHFTPKTIEKILKATGWRMEKVYQQRVMSNLIVSMGYVLRNSGYERIGEKLVRFPGAKAVWHYTLYPLAWVLAWLGQTGRMTVHARREG